jgi:hypothetical protein
MKQIIITNNIINDKNIISKIIVKYYFKHYSIEKNVK